MGGERGEGGGKKTLIGSGRVGGVASRFFSSFFFAFVALDFLKRPWLNWTYWPTNRGSVPTESRDRDNIDPRLRGGVGGEGGEGKKPLKEGARSNER